MCNPSWAHPALQQSHSVSPSVRTKPRRSAQCFGFLKRSRRGVCITLNTVGAGGSRMEAEESWRGSCRANRVLYVLTTFNIWIRPEIDTLVFLCVCRRHEWLYFSNTEEMDKLGPQRCLAAARCVTQRYVTYNAFFFNNNMTHYKQIELQIGHKAEDWQLQLSACKARCKYMMTVEARFK